MKERRPAMAHDVFISYATDDKPAADALCARLEQHGLRCWIAPRDILPGRDWRGSIVEAIASSRALVLMLSAKANTSTEIPKEILQATQKSLPIITFRIENVAPSGPLSYELNSIHWLDAVTRPLERHIDALAGTLQKLLSVDAPPMPPPRPTVTPTGGVSRSMFLYATTAVIVAVLGVGWWLRAPNPATAPMSAPAIATRAAVPQGDAGLATPRPADPTVDFAANLPASPSVGPPAPANSTRIVGCWRLGASPGLLEIRQDGSFVSGGVVHGTWSASNDANMIYAFDFPDEVAFGEVSDDGRTLINPNAPGEPWTRETPSSSIVGLWRISSGITLSVDADGTARMGPTLTGHWALADQGRRSYMFTWPVKPIVTGVADGNSIRYVDPQRGVNLTLVRENCP